MNIALIGYGKMGHLLEQVALQRGHAIVCIIDPSQANADARVCGAEGFDTDAFAQADVAIEFTTPATASNNIQRAWQKGVKVVCGTTGWDVDELRRKAVNGTDTLLWSSNFSIGVNILFAVNERLRELMRPHAYTPSITETHHVHKLDAPSGTAKTLAQAIGPQVPITSIRQGEVPGIHTVTWDSEEDTITLTHSAKSRLGFAQGAVLAAEWLRDKVGWHTMSECLEI